MPKGHGDAGAPAVTVSGLSPTNIESVYGFSTSPSAGGGETIAVVDAYDDPTAAADLANFSAQWSLPACATTGPNPCLTKVNETGGTSLPASGTNLAEGWDLEISLDIEWAHAVAPGARILLVEASSSNLGDLLTAEQYAGAHANYVTNSWGATEFNGEAAYDSDFSGSASYFAATGDVASEVDYPATSPNVVAVGGTSLKFTSGGAFSSETAWSDGGGGCSAYESATSSGQSTFSQYAQAGCNGKRAVPDVSLDADPASGVAVYDSTPYCPSSCSTGWYTVGGTSVATPIWAAESAVAGISATPPTIYSSSTPSFRDVTGGSNGHPTLVGYDLATGRGSWADGISGAPSGLTATGSNGQVALSWTAASGATSYNVYRGTSANGLSTTPIATVTGTTFGDTSVTNGTPYYYEVEGVNSLGTGSPSNEATATPSASIPSPPPSAPPAPTGLSASATSGGVNLAWTGATGATSYEVLRGTSSGTETKLVSGVTGTTYDDTSAAPGNTYYYEVEGVDSGVTGAPSNEAKAVMASSNPPGAPTGLSASATNAGVNLSWTGATGATSYEVLRGTSSGTETKLVTGVTGTTYDDTSVSSGNTYYYEVEGVKSGVTGAPSNEAKAVVASHISASISKSCSGSSCTFTSTSTDSGGTITTYSWTVSGATGSGSTFAHTFTSANTYTVALKLADNKGSTASASVNVSCVQSRSSIFRFSSSQLSCS